MAGCVLKLADNEYVRWSSVVGGPTTYILDRDDAVLHFGEEDVARADEHVTSARGWQAESAEEFITRNRGGEVGDDATLEKIREKYRLTDEVRAETVTYNAKVKSARRQLFDVIDAFTDDHRWNLRHGYDNLGNRGLIVACNDPKISDVLPDEVDGIRVMLEPWSV